MKRDQVENQIKIIIESGKNSKTEVSQELGIWLVSQEIDENSKNMILNDLESYSSFHNLEGGGNFG